MFLSQSGTIPQPKALKSGETPAEVFTTKPGARLMVQRIIFRRQV